MDTLESQRKVYGAVSQGQMDQRYQRAMGHYSSHGNYVHLFINGLYWGLYNPSERMDNDFAESYLYGDEQDFDVIRIIQKLWMVTLLHGIINYHG